MEYFSPNTQEKQTRHTRANSTLKMKVFWDVEAEYTVSCVFGPDYEDNSIGQNVGTRIRFDTPLRSDKKIIKGKLGEFLPPIWVYQ
jgi:hypothetical protein